MNKYLVLFILNVPFVIYGYIKVYVYWETKRAGRLGIFIRLVFWTAILGLLVFASKIDTFFIAHKITNSTRLSLPDVVLATGLNLVLFIVIRLYARLDALELRFTKLVGEQAINDAKLPKK